jgi:hypothetical protein
MLSEARSTCLWQENGKIRGSNFTYLKLQWSKLVSLDAMELQIHSSMRALKLDARISNWKHSNPAQFSSSIFMSLHSCSLNLHCILQTKGGFRLNHTQWARLCKENAGLCEENLISKRENFGGKLRSWIWKVSYEQKQLGFGFYMMC